MNRRFLHSFGLLACSALLILGIFSSGYCENESGRAESYVKKGASGLPIPRFVSLKSAEVNIRKGPGYDYKVSWIYKKAGLPVEVIGESDHWRHVRDSEGIEGWVFHSLLSSKRTVLVMPWNKSKDPKKDRESQETSSLVALYKNTSEGKDNVIAYLEPGIQGNIVSCSGDWCRLSLEDHTGWIRQEKLWGVYKNETVQ